jgi:hypothetical protein
MQQMEDALTVVRALDGGPQAAQQVGLGRAQPSPDGRRVLRDQEGAELDPEGDG